MTSGKVFDRNQGEVMTDVGAWWTCPDGVIPRQPEVVNNQSTTQTASVPIRFVSSEGFTPNWCAAKCAVRFEPVCANTGFFATLNSVLPCWLGCGQVVDFRG
jgi:hypothetical protein